MRKVIFSPELSLNANDLGLQISDDSVRAPLELRGPLESMGVRTADALVASLQSFPTAVTSQTGLDANAAAKAIAGALDLLRPYVDARIFQSATPQRRGLGAMPPRVSKN